jgi:ActR/RegA family two-component response regulator
MNDTPKTNEGKILIADDDTAFRNSLAALLARHDFECVGAPDATAAIALVESTRFDALIADIHMPGNAGLEFVETVPQIAAGLPIVLLTGRPSIETAARAVGLRVAAYLTKPPQIAELITLLQASIADYRCLRCVNESRGRLREWEAKLDCLARAFRNPKSATVRPSAGDYLRNNLQHVLHELAALEQSIAVWNGGSERKSDLHRLDLIAAVRHTIDVLEQTKQNFKCQRLGDLRRQLTDLLDAV